MADGILTQAEETLLREFRDRLAMDSADIDRKAIEQLERASTDRLMLAAIAVEGTDTHLRDLTDSLRQSRLYREQQDALLVQAWEAAVEGTLEDGLLTRDEENALHRYADHFRLSPQQLNRNGVQTTLEIQFSEEDSEVTPTRSDESVQVPTRPKGESVDVN